MPRLDAEDLIRRAVADFTAERFQAAEERLQEILAIESNHWKALLLLGVIALRTGKTADALEYTRRSISVRPDCAESHLNLGDVLKEQNRLNEAIEAYSMAVRLKPELAEARHSGSQLYEMQHASAAVPFGAVGRHMDDLIVPHDARLLWELLVISWLSCTTKPMLASPRQCFLRHQGVWMGRSIA